MTKTNASGTAPLLRVRDVAKTLGISDKSVRKLLERRVLPIVRVGKCVRVSNVALANFIAAGGAQ